MTCGVSYRGDSDLALLWLWYRPVTMALIQSLAWKHPYAAGIALKRPKKKNHTARKWWGPGSKPALPVAEVHSP